MQLSRICNSSKMSFNSHYFVEKIWINGFRRWKITSRGRHRQTRRRGVAMVPVGAPFSTILLVGRVEGASCTTFPYKDKKHAAREAKPEEGWRYGGEPHHILKTISFLREDS